MQNIFVEGCLLTASLVAQAVDASLGDRSTVFTKCLSECATNNGCSLNTARIEWIFEPCFSCKYDCTWRTVSYFTEVLNEEIPQFYGKWPFIAVRLPLLSFIPVQELASVVFSIMNLHSSLKMYRAVRLLPARARMKIVWYSYSLIGIFVWIASSLFHWADFWLTEYLDYFAAFAIIVYAFFASISFTVPYLQRTAFGRLIWLALFAALILFYFKHIGNLLVHFDYGYNMRCCIAFSLATAFIYTIWMAIEWHTRTRWQRRSIPFLAVVVFGGLASILLEVHFDYGYNMRCCIAFSLATAFIYTIWMAIEWHTRTRWQRRSIPFLAVVVFGGLASILLEVFDFVPLFWLVDAHALFHLATVPLPLYLITFIELETEYEMNLPAVATKIA
ncbi:Post-GPI attachment to proteins factor 3 [Toxocara canis]|uniref:Post-GPI attachment to proteins factor 3 n=1 Tax=Toxocara canis TaxID=6265 RepID=A0A0B2UTG5_TOXCA|nr:Post-GPI attachment to proteins factor 3 [Toxocara canis]